MDVIEMATVHETTRLTTRIIYRARKMRVVRTIPGATEWRLVREAS